MLAWLEEAVEPAGAVFVGGYFDELPLAILFGIVLWWLDLAVFGHLGEDGDVEAGGCAQGFVHGVLHKLVLKLVNNFNLKMTL